jgi:hypothetical protein
MVRVVAYGGLSYRFIGRFWKRTRRDITQLSMPAVSSGKTSLLVPCVVLEPSPFHGNLNIYIESAKKKARRQIFCALAQCAVR